MRVRDLFAAGLLLMLLAGPAAAEIRPHAFYLLPQGGVHVFDHDQDIETSPAYGLGVGYRFSSHWSAELTGLFIEAEEQYGLQREIDTYLGRIDILYSFLPQKRLVPYLAIGGGGLLFDHAGGSTDLDMFLNYGAGLELFLTRDLSFRLDARHMFTGENRHFDGKEFQNLSATAGLSYQFGGSEPRTDIIDTDGDGIIDSFDRCPDTRLGVPVDGFGCPADADRDGVPDYLDLCPGTPAGAAIDNKGCPLDSDKDGVADYLDQCAGTAAGQVVDRTGCPVTVADADGDGVEDAADQCPETPPGTPVNFYGCPVDSDQDGVADLMDKCPGTPAGVKVDETGCVPGAPAEVPAAPAPTSLQLNLEFAPGQAGLRPEFEHKLQEAVAFIRSHPGKRIVVEGHTDSVGPADYNLKLSQSRAETIRSYLIKKTGVAPQMVEARGYGEARPVADNSTQIGRAQNRRVVVRLAE